MFTAPCQNVDFLVQGVSHFCWLLSNLSRQGVIGRLAQDIATLSGVCGESEMKRRADIVTGIAE